VYFIDPPYIKAGGRLYRHSIIDHCALFNLAAKLKGDFLMTYDDDREVHRMADCHKFKTELIAMKNTHHAQKTELIIGKNLKWLFPIMTVSA
jgi:DNA adenine methylase